MFDTLNTFISAIVGWAPAILRIVASFITTLVMLPRLDRKLPGAAIDGSWLKMMGIMESWRMQTEYRIIAKHHKEKKARSRKSCHVRNVSFGITSQSQETKEKEQSATEKPIKNSK